jgi:tetratricopeptide (TPR) repeat protein
MRIRLILLEIIAIIMQAESGKSHMKKTGHIGWIAVVIGWFAAAGAMASVQSPGFIDATPISLGGDDALIDAQALVDFGELPVENYFFTRQTNASLVWDGTASFSIRTLSDEPAFAVFRTNTIEELEQYLRVFDTDINALTVLGVRQYQQHRIEESIASLRTVRKLQPSDVRSGELFSGILLQTNDLALIIDEVRTTLDQLPDNPVVRYNLACAYARMNDVDNAFHHLNVLYQSNWSDLVHHLIDPDLNNLMGHPRFVEFQNVLLQKYRSELNQTLLDAIFAPKL